MGFRSFIRRKVTEKLSNTGKTTAKAADSDVRALPNGVDSSGYTAVARIADIAPQTGRTVAVAGKAIAVFNLEGTFYAIDDACTHEDAPLGEGSVRGTKVICPYHDWVYDIQTGACITEPTRPVGCFSTKLHDGFVWVGNRTSDGTDDRGGDHADGLQTSEHAS